ncbi:MAG: xanthine dehydrogenase molybdopterin binding subunit [Polyangiaceae bacterium]
MKRDLHESAALHVSGEALYTHDFALRDPRALHAWPVQSLHAHAHIVRIDTTRALAAPGVRAVLTAADVLGVNDTGPVRHDEPLFPEEIMFVGQPVAWVLAEQEDLARRAAALVDVEVETLPAVVSLSAALQAEQFLTDPIRIERGDVARALERAPRRLEGELFVGGQEHFYLETQAAYAYDDESGEMFVHSSTQHPSETQTIVARVLGCAAHRVVCQSLRMGGAFGGKEVQGSAFACIAALGARKTGRPVSVRLDRRRDMTITGKRHPFLGRFRVGFDDRGKLIALDAELVSDGGFSLDLSEAIMWRALLHIDNCYAIDDLRVTGRVVRTNTPSNTAMRGFGGPQAMVIIEDIVDRVARTVGIDPKEVRERNFYRPGDRTHYGQAVHGADRIARIAIELGEESDYAGRRAAIETFNAAHPETKRGLAFTPVKFGISFTTTIFNQAGALVLVYRDGSVQVNHGGTEMGQGLHTKIRNVAARELGVLPEQIRIMPTRTDKVPNTSATAASSGSDLNGAAVREACKQLRELLAPIAASALGCPVETLRHEDGMIRGENGQSIALSEIAERAYRARVPLFAAGYYRTPNIFFDPRRGQGEPFHYFAYGACVAEVEVDGFTGQYKLRRVDVLQDVGDSLAPAIDRGQIEGGFVQGLGMLTCEDLRVGNDGKLLSRGASTYKLPGIGECPLEFHVRTLSRAAEPDVIGGSKATGEPPLMLAIAVREALRDAAGAFGPRGRLISLASPATPEAVYWAIRAAKSKG